MKLKLMFQNFITYAEESGRKWKKSSINIHAFLSFLAAIGFFINISKANTLKSILVNLLVLPFIFLAIFQSTIMRRVSKEKK